MKKFKNIFLLSGLLLGIVFVWLIPKTKGEKKTQYVRVYTEEKEIPVEEDSARTESTKKKGQNREEKKTKKERVVIQTDTLREKPRMKDFKVSLYSRSMHFVPVEIPDPATASLDSVSMMTDSIGVAAVQNDKR